MIKINFNSAMLDLRLMGAIAGIEVAEDLALKKAGKHLMEEMKRTIYEETEDWVPLHPLTVMLKGHDKILIDTSEMIESIKWKKRGDYVTIGVHDNAPNDRATIALIHEHGNEDVPARPFIIPTWEREKKHVERNFKIGIESVI